MDAMTEGQIAGFDTARIGEWLEKTVGAKLPVQWTKLTGGHSNLTYLLRDSSGQEMVIRRPPLGELLPKAHDMFREYRIIKALWPTDVPVAEPIAYCDDPAVAESHFYLMGRSTGQALYDQPGTSSWLRGPARQRAGESLAAVLAALHSLEPEAIGLGDLGRAEGYVARQLKTWYSSWTAQVPNSGVEDRRVHELHELLSTEMPESPPTRVVHGDYGPHNVLFRESGEISAVVDWEIATLGDPLADLGYTINAWVGPSDEVADVAEPATALPGFSSRQEVLSAYVAATGADVSNLDYYRAFNFWKRACILQGVYARYRSGQKGTEGVDMAVLLGRIGRSLTAAAGLAKPVSDRG
jgi:aminoglycoside phosphotransferase (APT) family kinase protein